MNLLDTWLYDKPSGEPTPWKEYRIRSIIDWFPRLYFGLLMGYVAVGLNVFGDTSSMSMPKALIPRLLLSASGTMFVPNAFPVDMITPKTNQGRMEQLNKIFIPGFVVGFGWAAMSLFLFD